MHRINRAHAFGISVAVAALCPIAAFAQLPQTADADKPEVSDQDIIVTGTLIRGIAPVGSNVISASAEQLKSSGGNSTNQLLGTIPQLVNLFNTVNYGVSAVSGANATSPITRPNLRNLPAANTSGGAQTLVLLDGHRLVGGGTTQIAVDPDMIAPGVIQRVEAMTDGGSAVYGSDALGGVLNFITRKRFNGLQVGAKYGYLEDYGTTNANIMAGKDWGTGGVYIAYGYTHSDALFGRDRSFIHRVDWSTPNLTPTGRNCAAPTVSAGGSANPFYLISGAGLTGSSTPNICDISADNSFLPRTTLHNVFAKLQQDLSDNVHFEVTALYANRKVDYSGGAEGNGGSQANTAGTVTITPTIRSGPNAGRPNPYYRPITGNPTATQTVNFDYSPLTGTEGNNQHSELETFSIAPQLSVDLGSSWQARAMMSYGWSKVSYSNAVPPSSSNQQALVDQGLLNPYNIAGSDPATLASIVAGRQAGYGRNELFDYRAIVDGPLFSLPAGDVHVAVGGEYMADEFHRQITNANLVLSAPISYRQTVKSVFGELNVPLFSQENGMPLLRELTVSASARYDKYNDFGDTFNPKVGVTYKPVSWIAIRGNWGKSFNAPTPVDQIGGPSSTAAPLPANSPTYSAPPLVPGVCGGALPACSIATGSGIFMSGTISPLQPQTAKNWSVGIDVKPPILPGLSASISYYHISLDGTIGRPVTGANLAPFYNNFPTNGSPQLWIYQPTGLQVAQFLHDIPSANQSFVLDNPGSSSRATINGGTVVSAILDTRVRNLGHSDIAGLDFSVNYVHPTDFGSIDASFAGNYRLKQDTRVSPASAVVDDTAFDFTNFRWQATLGANIGNLRAQAIYNYTGGYKLSVPLFGQTKINPFTTLNLFFQYDVKGSSIFTQDLSLTLNVTNVLAQKPITLLNNTQPGFDTGVWSPGRGVQFGINKKF